MLERLLDFSLRRSHLVLVLTLVGVGLGLHALVRLPIDAVPDITNNQVQINTVHAALSPTEIERQVTFVVETSLAGIPGLQYTRSLSRNGFSQVTAVFDDDVDIYFARTQVAERLLEARESLPPGAEPGMGPIATGLGEVFMWVVEYEHPDGRGATVRDGEPGWQGDGSYRTPEGERLVEPHERAAYLRTVQDWIIRPQLKGLPDVAGIDSIGGFVKEYHVQPEPMKMISYGITFHEIVEALERNNASTGAGYVEHRGQAYQVRAAGLLTRPEEIARVVVGQRGGTPIYVADLAEVIVGKELRTGSASRDGNEAVVGTALMLIGANSRTVAHAVGRKLEQINRGLPPDVRALPVLDRTKLVDATVATVTWNLGEGAILVIAILFAMLGNFRAAVITALAIPLSMLLCAIGMVESRVSGNLMSLGAVDFGLIVDGAVILVENTLRRLAEEQHRIGRVLERDERFAVVKAAAAQVLDPAAFGCAIIMTVYLPILALTGIEGKMFRPMALTVLFALAAAFVLALTFVPALTALVLRGRVQERENRIVTAARRAYEPLLHWALRRRGIVVAAAAGAFAASVALFLSLGQEFVPTLDEQDFAMHAMRIPSVSLTQSTAMQLEVERAISALPEVAFVFSKTGTAEMASDPMPPNVSDTFIILKPRAAWPDPSEPKEHLRRRIEAALERLPGNVYEFTQPIQMRFNELIAGVRSDVAVKVFGDEFEPMLAAAGGIARILRRIPGAADVKVEQTTGLPGMNVEVDREAIGRYGLSVADVQEGVAVAVGGRRAGQVFEGDRRFDVVVRLREEDRRDLATIEHLPIPLPAVEDGEGHGDGSLRRPGRRGGAPAGASFIPLESVARIEVREGINQVSRENGKRRIVVQANVRGRDLASFVAEAEERIAAEVALPAGYWLEWGGQFENLVAARRRLSIVVPIAFALILVLLVGALGEVRQAFMVFACIPLGLTGGVVALWLRGIPFSISAGVGFIALSGVAVLNGLVLMTFFNQLRAQGVPWDEVIVRGSLTRLRPVLMTALVASFGFVPMALATGTGAEVQRPLATVVIGGLVTSTALTLLVLPALVRMFERGREAAAGE